jgi:DNA-binding response OmpR family regulator
MSSANKQSVLIIDSDNAIVNDLTKRLKNRDMVVITAKDGYEGYVRACKEAPDIIILDTLLSSMSGFRVSRLLKYDERFQHIKVVMITSNDLQAIEETYKSCGADEILRKPFRFKELMDAISTKEEQLV